MDVISDKNREAVMDKGEVLDNLIRKYTNTLNDEKLIKDIDMLSEAFIYVYKKIPISKLNKVDHVVFYLTYVGENSPEKVIKVTKPNPFRELAPLYTVADIFKGVAEEVNSTIFSNMMPYVIKIDAITNDKYEVEIVRLENVRDDEFNVLINERAIDELEGKVDTIDGATGLGNIFKSLGTSKQVEKEKHVIVEDKESSEEKESSNAYSDIIEEDASTIGDFRRRVIDRVISNYQNTISHDGTFMNERLRAVARRTFLEEFRDVFVNNYLNISNEIMISCEVLSGRVLIKKEFLDSDYTIFSNYMYDDNIVGSDLEKFVNDMVKYDCEEVVSLNVNVKVYEYREVTDKFNEDTYNYKEAISFRKVNGTWEATKSINY